MKHFAAGDVKEGAAAAVVENQLAAAVEDAGFDVVECGAPGSAVVLGALGRHALVVCAQLEPPDVLARSDEVRAVHQVAIAIADVLVEVERSAVEPPVSV